MFCHGHSKLSHQLKTSTYNFGYAAQYLYFCFTIPVAKLWLFRKFDYVSDNGT